MSPFAPESSLNTAQMEKTQGIVWNTPTLCLYVTWCVSGWCATSLLCQCATWCLPVWCATPLLCQYVNQFLTKFICWQNRVQMKQWKALLFCLRSKDCWENSISFRKDCALSFRLHHEVNDTVHWEGKAGESSEYVGVDCCFKPQMLAGKVLFPFPVCACVCVWKCSCVYTCACGACAHMHACGGQKSLSGVFLTALHLSQN